MSLSAEMFEMIVKGLKTYLPESDNRASLRVGIRARLKLTRMEGAQMADAIQVLCRDISSGGLSFLHTQPLRNGTRYLLEIAKENDQSLRLWCEVVRKQKVDSLYLIGAKFVEPDVVQGGCTPLSSHPTPSKAAPGQDLQDEISRIRNAVMNS